MHPVAKMSNAARLLKGASALGLLLALASCDFVEGGFDGGYEKVAVRERTDVPQAPAPNPPPYIAGFAGGGASAVPTLDEATAPAGVTQAMVESGQKSFGTICVACHGGGGSGTAAAPALNDAEWLNISGNFEEIAALIQSGVPTPKQFPGAMPPMGGGNFTPDQVRELAAYVFALSHASAQ